MSTITKNGYKFEIVEATAEEAEHCTGDRAKRFFLDNLFDDAGILVREHVNSFVSRDQAIAWINANA